MKPTLEEIKEQCRAVIALAEKATPGPWVQNEGDTCNKDVVWRRPEMIGEREGFMTGKTFEADASFIAFSRSFTPMAAKALLIAIEGLELIAFMREAGNQRDLSPNGLHTFDALESIREQFTNTQA